MSPNRRIFLNFIATCGRRMDALVSGLFVSRWGLAAVGKFERVSSCRSFYHRV